MSKVLLKVNNKVISNDGKLIIGEKQEGTLLKTLLDNTKSAQYLFYGYKGDNLSDLIQYNDTENVTNFNYMYYGCTNATSLPLINTSNGIDFNNMYNGCRATSFPNIDTSKGTEFNYMYYGCTNATSFPNIDTSKGTEFNYMYYGCSKATIFPQINTSNGTNFSNMFADCYSATKFPQIDTSKGTTFSAMFSGCSKATKLDITKWALTSTSSTYMLQSCYYLKSFIIRSFGEKYVLNSNAFSNCYYMLGQTHSYYNPNGEQGYIYVPRDMISILQNETNWSTMQFRALEDYTKDGTTTGEFDDEKAGV